MSTMPGPVAPFLDTVLRDSDTCVGSCIRNWKIGFATILFLEALVCGHIVYLLKRLTAASSRRFSYVFHLGNALSGGVLFATGMLHIFPEAIALFSGEHSEHSGEEEGERWISLRQGEDHEDEEGEQTFPWAYLIVMLTFYVIFFLEKILLPKILSEDHLGPSESDQEMARLETDQASTKDDKSAPIPVHAHGFRSRNFVNGAINILGISAHSLFESIAIGLSPSFTIVLNVFIATVSHRWATAAAIGFRLLKTLNYLPFLVLLLLFSAIAPIGIAIGAALGNLSATVQGVLFAISAGTFLHIGLYEVMVDEFVEHRQWPLTKFLMTLIGVSAIVVVTVILHVLDIHG